MRRPRSGPARVLRLASALVVAAVLETALSGEALAAADGAPPPDGRYDATLCVSRADEAASCGSADLELRAGGGVRVQVSDIVYRLQVRPSRGSVVVTHGAMQVDEFDTAAAWAGALLRFDDAEKRLRYEVRVGEPKRTSR